MIVTKMNFLKAATLTRYRRCADRSVSITFITDTEQSSEDVRLFDECSGKSGFVFLKAEKQLTVAEMAELEKTELHNEGKSKAQRLRGVLYKLHQQAETEVGFDQFYSGKMEEIIEHFKAKLKNQ
jgi:hypothetical protein